MKKTTTNLDTSTVNTVEYWAINCSLRMFSGQKNKRIKMKCFLGLNGTSVDLGAALEIT